MWVAQLTENPSRCRFALGFRRPCEVWRRTACAGECADVSSMFMIDELCRRTQHGHVLLATHCHLASCGPSSGFGLPHRPCAEDPHRARVPFFRPPVAMRAFALMLEWFNVHVAILTYMASFPTSVLSLRRRHSAPSTDHATFLRRTVRSLLLPTNTEARSQAHGHLVFRSCSLFV